jgi:hypothetical protein
MVEFIAPPQGATELLQRGDGASRTALWQPVTPELQAVFASMKDTPKWAKARASKARRKRAGVPLRCYMGPNGSGKSATAVYDLLHYLRGHKWQCINPDHYHTRYGIFEGYTLVYSTVDLFQAGTGGQLHPLYRRLTDWEPFLYAEHAAFFLDEITGIANSRNYSALPVQVQAVMEKQRKAKNAVVYTGPRFEAADSVIRGVTQLVTDTRAYFPVKDNPDEPSAWRPRRLIRARSFDAKDRASFDKGSTAQDRRKDLRLRPAVTQWWWGPGSEVFESYSSEGAVSRVGSVSDSGVCANCGGTRTRPKCTCDH